MSRPGVSLFNTFQTEFGRTTHTGRSSLALLLLPAPHAARAGCRLAASQGQPNFLMERRRRLVLHTRSNAAGDLRAALLLIEVSPCLTPRMVGVLCCCEKKRCRAT